MPIKVACKCGASFSAKDELAGRTVKCPKCSNPLQIPGGGALGELFDEAGVRAADTVNCPNCHAVLSPEVVLCVHCGYNLQTGQKMVTRRGGAAGFDDDDDDIDYSALESHGNEVLDRAERELLRQASQQRRMSKGAPWWVFLIALLALLGFAAGMVMMDQDNVLLTSGWILISAGIIISTFFHVRILIVTFEEGALHLVLSLFVPFYVLYYIFTRWERVGGFFLMSLVGSIISGAGIGALMIAPMFVGNTTALGQDPPIKIERLETASGASAFVLANVRTRIEKLNDVEPIGGREIGHSLPRSV